MNVIYCYIPKISENEASALLSILSGNNINITHLGKNDPPRKWVADACTATQTILSGEELTSYTFFSDKKCKIEGTIEIHRDPRWKHDSVSISGPDQGVLEGLGRTLHTELQAYLTIFGVIGLGKDQEWTPLGIRSDCPAEMISKLRLSHEKS